MFSTFPTAMRSGPFALALFFAGFGAAFAHALPWLWAPYCLGCLLLIVQAFMLAYVNERFTCYASTMMIGRVAMVAFLGVLATFFLVHKEWGYPAPLALLICLVPAVLMTAVYLAVFLTKTNCFPFEVNKGRVSSLHVQVDRYSVLIGGLAAAGSTLLVKLLNAEAVLSTVAVLMFACCLFLIVYSRNVIRGLRALRAQERREGCVFTFENLEQVRDERRQWLLGRLAAKISKGS